MASRGSSEGREEADTEVDTEEDTEEDPEEELQVVPQAPEKLQVPQSCPLLALLATPPEPWKGLEREEP